MEHYRFPVHKINVDVVSYYSSAVYYFFGDNRLKFCQFPLHGRCAIESHHLLDLDTVLLPITPHSRPQCPPQHHVAKKPEKHTRHCHAPDYSVFLKSDLDASSCYSENQEEEGGQFQPSSAVKSHS